MLVLFDVCTIGKLELVYFGIDLVQLGFQFFSSSSSECTHATQWNLAIFNEELEDDLVFVMWMAIVVMATYNIFFSK